MIKRHHVCIVKKICLKIPKGQSETVYQRRTDNTMVKRKSTKEYELKIFPSK
jgi:hypothetical protein